MYLSEDDKFFKFVLSIKPKELESELDRYYYYIKEKLNITSPLGFTQPMMKILAGATCLSIAYPNIQMDIVEGIANVMLGNMGVFAFPDYIYEIVKMSPISEKTWFNTCEYFNNNHKWLKDHVFTEFYR